MNDHPVRLSPHHFRDKAHLLVQCGPFTGPKMQVCEFLFDRYGVVCTESSIHFLTLEGIPGGRSGQVIMDFFLDANAMAIR